MPGSGDPMSTPRERLLKMRDEELARMMRRGQLPQITAIDTALATLDEAPPKAEPASRAVVSDDGRAIRLVLYSKAGAVASVVLG